ncbi:1,2-phenylacetyl-CoA epoxidase catalytic subunit [Roseibium hamelinense]|uniref:1,2-phenylacetyl-CoA epoxidase catalytic subunit n=1 Tax=Roseibium hamelinense TaxID=150831 RepID=A0A562TJ15_9HYPH|nr:Phenylacetic acid catabolic protein [Roseibium hamelinense]MTI45880.1 phenylacetic acid catabolic [Roseibium hamelinense]TWI92936.1 1,2-phenylacetyl-CoA epoxidase catalytic subunit [Roseibium hamelinense]
MSETMELEDYLAAGGKLSTPLNAPPRYRGELMRLMASFVDSELAGSAGFADVINEAPGIKSRIAAARIVLEKADHAERVLEIMGEFGADTARYAVHQPWSARLDRHADLGQVRRGGDMRLSVFHYPLEGWTDAVVFNVLMGLATGVQLDELCRISFAPLAEIFRDIAPREKRHTELGIEGLELLATQSGEPEKIRASAAYWMPRVEATFGLAASKRFDIQKKFGLRHMPNEDLAGVWKQQAGAELQKIGIT